jgi:NAD(P)-dependent dehydrogenase (short-subunit alcohol dehydrogenase family)
MTSEAVQMPDRGEVMSGRLAGKVALITGAARGQGRAMQANPRIEVMFSTMLPIANTDPSDHANAVVYLASDEARYVTALAMTVDNGMTQY